MVNVRRFIHFSHERWILRLELERGEQVQREAQILGHRRDEVVLDRQAIPDGADLLVVDEIGEDCDLGPRIVPLILDLARGVEGVGRYRHRTQLERGVKRDDRLWQIGQLNGHPVTLLDPQHVERGRESIHLILELSIGNPGVENNQGRAVAVPLGCTREKIDHRRVFELKIDRHAVVVELVPRLTRHRRLLAAPRGERLASE